MLTSLQDPAEAVDEHSLAEEIEWYLLARLAAQRAVCLGGSLPLLLDGALAGLDEDQLGHVLGRLERMADAVQVIVVSDDPLGRLLGPAGRPGPGRRRAPPARLNRGSNRREDHLTSPDSPRSGGAVAVITEAAIRELAGIRGDIAPITSCYLDVDGRRLTRHQDVEHELEGVLRSARSRANGHRSVHDDLRRIEAFVKGGFDRHETRGLAIFACAASDLWEVIELPKPVRSCLVINHAPAVGQLESMVQEHEPVGVLLADRQRAQLYVFELGRLVDHSELLDELPRDYDSRGERERGTPAHHREELAHQHLRHAARAAFDLWQARGFHHLAIGAPGRHRRRARGRAAPVPPRPALRAGPRRGRCVAGRGAGRRRGGGGRGGAGT